MGICYNTQNNTRTTQHKNLGTKLIRQAEFISWMNNYKNISIISGVGVRNYYKKKGYNLIETYMIKYFKWIDKLKILGYFVYDCFYDYKLFFTYLKLIKFF